MSAISILQSIARYYLPGQLVQVKIFDLEWALLRGQAYRKDSGTCVIVLDWRHADDGETFFHELAHHVKGHVKVACSPDMQTETLSEMDFSEVERNGILRYIDEIEIEAQTWAARELANFERAFGPFAKAVFEAPADGDGQAV